MALYNAMHASTNQGNLPISSSVLAAPFIPQLVLGYFPQHLVESLYDLAYKKSVREGSQRPVPSVCTFGTVAVRIEAAPTGEAKDRAVDHEKSAAGAWGSGGSALTTHMLADSNIGHQSISLHGASCSGRYFL
jgi:hypothetical protein